ncbi:MAG: hypothetical protein ACFFFH_18140, partial [Candidatus Thorarchaeota archaeon]
SGKIARQKKADVYRKKIQDRVMSKLNIEFHPSISKKEKENISLFCMKWDESFGPEVLDYYPQNDTFFPIIQQVGVQLFHSSVAIYGSNGYSQAQGILLRVEAIDKSAFIYFDSIQTEDVRGGERLFMLAVLAPKINYFESMKINEIFSYISPLIKNSQAWDIKSSWQKVCDILTTSNLNFEY